MKNLLFVLILLASSCRCPEMVTQAITRDSIVYVDTTITIHDSIPYQVSIDIDSLLQTLNGSGSETIAKSTKRGVTTRLIYRNGILTCESTIDSLERQISYWQHHKQTDNTVVVQVEREKNKFELFQFYWFIFSVVAIALYLANKLR